MDIKVLEGSNKLDHHHHNLFDILHVFTRKIKINIANKTYKHPTT